MSSRSRLVAAVGLAVLSYRLGYRAGMVQSARDDECMRVLNDPAFEAARQRIAEGVERVRRGGGPR